MLMVSISLLKYPKITNKHSVATKCYFKRLDFVRAFSICFGFVWCCVVDVCWKRLLSASRHNFENILGMNCGLVV